MSEASRCDSPENLDCQNGPTLEIQQESVDGLQLSPRDPHQEETAKNGEEKGAEGEDPSKPPTAPIRADGLCRQNSRIENDCLYGEILLPAVLSKIINTKEFQRLRRIKQLGGVDYIYKDATHSRYEHSIGTAFLVRVMTDFLRREYPDVCDAKDALCVQIAALCHDLGHGPFSYAFRSKVLPQLKIDSSKHKDIAYCIFKKIWMRLAEEEPELVSENNLDAKDMFFIRELIRGTPAGTSPIYKGREEPKWKLYKLFSNEARPVDACKCDYMARDCLSFGRLKGNLLDDLKSLKNGIALKGEVEAQDSSDEIFASRGINWKAYHALHEDMYQSPDVNAVEHMISDAIVWADDYLHISKNFKHLDFFCGLDEHILLKIRELDPDSDPKVADAQETLENLDKGKYYDFVDTLKIKIDGDQNLIDNQKLIEEITEVDPSISGCKIRISVLRKEAVKCCGLQEDEKAIQVFTVDPLETNAVRFACGVLWESLDKDKSNQEERGMQHDPTADERQEE